MKLKRYWKKRIIVGLILLVVIFVADCEAGVWFYSHHSKISDYTHNQMQFVGLLCFVGTVVLTVVLLEDASKNRR